MDFTETDFASAADKFTDTEHRLGKWEIWEKYEIRPQEHGGRYILAVEPDDSELPPRVDLEKPLKKTGETVRPGSHEEELVRRAVERRKLRKKGYVYYPLAENPDLFLEFARLADGGGLDNAATVRELDTDKNANALLDWAWEHGTLGLTPSDEERWFRGASTRGGPLETVAAFAREAWVANGCLRLYEAATAAELDEELIASYVGDHRGSSLYTRTPASTRAWALEAVARETQAQIAGNAYPALYGEVGRFVSGWSFSNLLGAMWLQMFWLLASEQEPRRCRHCDKIIAYGNSDQRKRGPKRKFCDDSCRASHHYETVTKPARLAKLTRGL